MRLPDINLVATTYFPPGEPGRLRKAGFAESVASWRTNLVYHGNLNLIVVNDGPAAEALQYWDRRQANLGHKRNGAGASLNQGIRHALETSPLVANIDDDWMLTEPYNLTPSARMLLEHEGVGAVHLSAPYPGTTGTIHPLPHGWVVVLNRHNLAAGLRACLYHQRWFDAYGWYDEGISAWESERLYNERFCQSEGPESVLALPFPWKEGIGSTVLLGQENPCTSP